MTFTETIERAREESRTLLSEVEAKIALAEAGVPVTVTRLAQTREEAVAQAEALRYPVALKVTSPNVAHKSDVGGVVLGLENQEEVANAYDEIISSVNANQPEAIIEGVSVQEMTAPGVEVIIGMTTDPQFGPVMMFGLGGIMVEVLGDVAFRLAPLGTGDAQDMINEIKGRQVLDGVRGQPPVDIDAIELILDRVSAFAAKHPEVLELDLNPVIASPEGAIAVDARIVLAEA
ncbi:MAG: acetyl-CoA synthetase [Dehalococcoidia bacterium]|nr:acetyl-CoA synthetase [Dehalococcoidia bacterium]HCV00472.1 acetyl-CoA synthetase [Dehalococcoidia bacterium]|tara:strand:+ start:345 stop:1043 length:699 start_codon:yes stop_codon:yes gene_type:complete